ncbi:hypothetical protein GR927_23020 [Mycolicibacterium sp. 3033]|nr:hypothetical protein [Mycolicibacterium aurantiacum]
MGSRRPDIVAYHDCEFVITLTTRERLSYEAGSDLRVEHGVLTAITPAGLERRVDVHDWQDVIIDAGDVLTNRYRRRRPDAPESSTSPPPTSDDSASG